MKISLRWIFVIVAIFGLFFAVVGRMVVMNNIKERWSKIGGRVTKDVFPILGWDYVCLGATSQSHSPQSIENVNTLILQITNQQACTILRLERSVVESLQFESSSDADTLKRLLAGVDIDTVELIDWDMDEFTIHAVLVGMDVRHWRLRHSSMFDGGKQDNAIRY